MRIKRYSAAISAILIAVAVFALPATPLAAEGNTPKPNQEQKYIAVLRSNAPLSEKARACQELAVIGTKDAVPVLSALLADEALSDYARFALEPIEDPSVDEALREAMGKLEGRLLVGLINSIGARRDAKAVGALSKLAADPASPVASEAIAALGRIATDQSIETIVRMLSTGPVELRNAAADACLAAAERLLASNENKEAVKIYDAVRSADIPGHLRAAATSGAILARGSEGTSLLVEQLKTNDPAMVEIALRAARQLPGPEVTRALVAELDKSRPIVQVLLIKVLSDRKDPGAYQAIRVLATSKSSQVRIESLKVLGQIGDASAVPVLLKAAAAQGEEADVAGAALRTLEGEGVDQAIIEGTKTAKGQMRAELIGILADRRCTAAIPALLTEAAAKDEAVATAAYKALTSLAGPEDLPRLVELLAGLSGSDARSHAENAVVAAASRTENAAKRTDSILAKLNTTDRIDSRTSLLRVLGRIADDKALNALQDALSDKDETVRDTAVRALSAWPDSKALKTLATVSQTASNNTRRVLALRGYVRLLGLDTELSPKDKAAMYKLAMNTAGGDNEKKLVLAGLANVAHPDVLDVILDYVDQPETKNEAILAAIKVAQAVAGARPRKARAAAMKVASETTNQQVREQARSLISTIDKFDDFIVAWQVTGPYSQQNRNYSELFDIAFPPESADSDVRWSLMPAATDAKRPWILDLLKLYGGNSRVAYVRTWIKSDKRRQVVLEAGSDDGIKAWLNGRLVHANNVARAAIPSSDKTNITLNEGWNRLMLKITQNVDPWEFCMRIRNADGSKVEGIEVDCLGESP